MNFEVILLKKSMNPAKTSGQFNAMQAYFRSLSPTSGVGYMIKVAICSLSRTDCLDIDYFGARFTTKYFLLMNLIA